MAVDSNNTAARLHIKVTPNARRNEITGFNDGVLYIRIATPPDKGKANKELIAYLSRRLDISRSSVRLLRGHTSRNKVISIGGLDESEVIRRIITR